MFRHLIFCFLMLLTLSVSAANGGKGSDGGNGSDGGSADNTPGRPGCPGGSDPDSNGRFYLPGTQEQCNPGKQDSLKKAR